MRRFLSVLFNIIVIFIITVSGLYIASATQTRYDPSHVASVLGFTPLTVISGSMSPNIETGDLVIVKNGNKNIKPGDIVTYRLDNVLVTHRVKSISNDNEREVFITQGDANSVADFKAVERSQILGKCVLRIPMGGYIKASLRGLPGMLILLGLVLICIMTEVLNRTKERVDKVRNLIA